MTTLEAAVEEFLYRAAELQQPPLLSSRQLIDRLVSFYREVRVSGADLAMQGDMLLLQWGTTQPWLLSDPTDLRSPDIAAPEQDPQAYQYFDVTRQIFVASGGDDEFDDSGLQMNFTMVFELARGDEPQGNVWAGTPEDVATALVTVEDQVFPSRLLEKRPARIVAAVDLAG